MCTFRSFLCCCCGSRSGAVFTGIINLICGTAGLVILYFTLTGISKEMNHIHKTRIRPNPKLEQTLDQLAERYWFYLLTYTLPTIVAFLTGFTVILATVKNNESLVVISLLMEGLLTIALISITFILFYISFSLFPWTLSVLPLWLWAAIEIYFILVLVTYKMDLVHYEGGVEGRREKIRKISRMEAES